MAPKVPEIKRKTASCNAALDNSSPEFSRTNCRPDFCTRPNGKAVYAPKHQTKRHFSIFRDIWILHQLPQEVSNKGFSLGRFSTTHPIGIPFAYWNIGRSSAPQPVRETSDLGIPGCKLGYNAKLTHQAIRKTVHIYPKRSPARFFGVLSLAVSFGSLGCVY